jgi:tRNA (guanosine-2'-O-)-methyltransferase
VNHLIVAPLWVAFTANLGTLLRTCDAVGACMAVLDTDHYRRALRTGDTLRVRPCLHWVDSKLGWIERQQDLGAQIIGVELDEDSIPLSQVRQAKIRSIVLLGHEREGLPHEVWSYLDQVVEIPMVGWAAPSMRRSPAHCSSTNLQVLPELPRYPRRPGWGCHPAARLGRTRTIADSAESLCVSADGRTKIRQEAMT